MFIPCYSGFHFSSLCFTLSGFRTFFQIHTSIYSFSHSRTGWKTFGHVQLSHKRRSVAGMLITHRTIQWCAEQRSLGCGRGRGAYFIRLSTGVKSCLKWYSLLTDRTTASLLFDFVNRSHDYRPNWTILGPIIIINRICDQNHSIADYVRNRRGKVTNNLNGSGQYNWSTWSNIDRLYETVYFRKLSLFRFNLSILLNSLYYFLYHVIFGWMIWSLIITLDTLSIWLFALPVGCSQKPYRCIHSSTWRLFKNHQSCKSEGSRNREKVFVQRLSQLNCEMKKWHWSAFFDVANPKGNSSLKLLRIEDFHPQFRENKLSFFFVARKTIAKGKVQAKYLKHLNYSFILMIGFFFLNFDFNVTIL